MESQNKKFQRPTSGLWTKEDIMEFFKSIGKPLKDVTKEMEGKSSIILLNKPPQNSQDEKPKQE